MDKLQENKQDIRTKNLTLPKYYLRPLLTKDQKNENDILNSMNFLERQVFRICFKIEFDRFQNELARSL